MSYELRTPLTSIGGFAEMLAAGYAGKLAPAAADYVGAILESVARLSKLIDDVLDLTQGDTSGVVLERERIDLAGLCRSVGETLQRPRRREEADARARRSTPRPASSSAMRAACANRSSMCCATRSPTPTRAGKILLRAAGDDDAAIDHRRRQWPGHRARGPGRWCSTASTASASAPGAARRRSASACR